MAGLESLPSCQMANEMATFPIWVMTSFAPKILARRKSGEIR